MVFHQKVWTFELYYHRSAPEPRIFVGSQGSFFSWIRKSWMFISYILGHEWFCTDECKHLVHQSIVDFLVFDSIHYCNYTKTCNLFFCLGIGRNYLILCSRNMLSLWSVPILVNILGLWLIKRKLWLEFPLLFRSVF